MFWFVPPFISNWLAFLLQRASSTAPNPEQSIDQFVKGLSPDEVDLSIEIFTELQKALLDVHGNESSGDCSEIHTEAKEEKEADSATTDFKECLELLVSCSKIFYWVFFLSIHFSFSFLLCNCYFMYISKRFVLLISLFSGYLCGTSFD